MEAPDKPIVILIAVLIALLLLGLPLVIRTYSVPTPAMEPTLPAGTHVAVRLTQDVQRGDIVVFRYPENREVTYLKRIVAAGGDRVEIRDKKLLVNGAEVSEPYAVHADPRVYPRIELLPEPYRSRDQFGPYVVPTESFFMLGDNRDRSSDSRYWGVVSRADVIGRVVVRYSLKGGFRRVKSAH